MLRSDFYFLTNIVSTDHSIEGVITLNPNHKIFAGHFPGMPIVPGVCMMQIVKEVTEIFTAKRLTLHQADNIKFLSVINPQQVRDIVVKVQIKTQGLQYEIIASLSGNDQVYFRFSGSFQEQA